MRTAAARVAAKTLDVGETSVAWVIEENGLPAAELGQAIVDGTVLGPYEDAHWKTEKEGRGQIERLVLCGPGARAAAEAAERTNVAATTGRTATGRCQLAREHADARRTSPPGPRRSPPGASTSVSRRWGRRDRAARRDLRRSARGATTRPG